ncbi:MAG: hypothetical protein JNK23_08510 [Opitutaceae bacterium]|nr:hypothetical protein [Opitutaceae bacterium]
MNTALNLWRRWVIFFARKMPIESPGICTAFCVLFLLTAVYLLPELSRLASEAPMFREALDGATTGWRWLRGIEIAMVVGACTASWIFQARCLQICFPDFYDQYADE